MTVPNKELAAQPVEFRMVELGPVPRELTGQNEQLLRRVAHNMWELMDPDEKFGSSWGAADVMLAVFFSVITVGILPAVFWGAAVRRRSRYRRFIKDGLPALARVLEMTEKDVGFGVKHTRVRYEFEAEGRLHRDADLVLPVIAQRWDPGSIIQVLYLPDANFESVIISTA